MKKRKDKDRLTEAEVKMEEVRRLASKRPGRGTGTDGSDLYQYQRPSMVTRPEDDRKGKTFCEKCKAEVTHVEVQGKWYVRDPDGTPHALSCAAS